MEKKKTEEISKELSTVKEALSQATAKYALTLNINTNHYKIDLSKKKSLRPTLSLRLPLCSRRQVIYKGNAILKIRR